MQLHLLRHERARKCPEHLMPGNAIPCILLPAGHAMLIYALQVYVDALRKLFDDNKARCRWDLKLELKMETVAGPKIPCKLYSFSMFFFPFIDDFPIKTSIYKGFSTAMLNNQMVDGLWRLLPSANCSSNCWWYWFASDYLSWFDGFENCSCATKCFNGGLLQCEAPQL